VGEFIFVPMSFAQEKTLPVLPGRVFLVTAIGAGDVRVVRERGRLRRVREAVRKEEL
jgi:hypothetical protein